MGHRGGGAVEVTEGLEEPDDEGDVAGGQVAILFTKLAKTGENDQLAVGAQRRDGANG